MNYRNLIVILIAVLFTGCKEEPPTASFTFNPQNPDVNMIVNFTNSSTKASSYTWDFGDGTTPSTSENPTHVYTNEGVYTVELKAINEDGSDTYTASVPVNHPPPVAAFTADKTLAYVDEEVTFSNQSEDAVSYSWDFGDGTTPSTSENPTHRYDDDGIYTIELTATGAGGDTDVATTDIEIMWPPPDAAFSMDATSPTAPEVEIQFTNESVDAVSYSWDFGDGSTSTDTDPTHSYSAEGIYTIQLTATGRGGDTDVATSSITIEWPPPVADFSMDKSMVGPGETVTFTNTSQWAESYSWDFGDGSSSTATDPTHSYASLGTYTVTLTATGYNAGTDTHSSTVTVCQPPVASFTFSPPDPELGENVIFTNTSTDATSYSWDFGDGTTSTSEHPTHVYSAGGLYTVTLTATGDCGSDTYSDDISIPFPPVPINIFPGVGIMDMVLEDTWGTISTQLDDWVYLGWGYIGTYILHLVESPSTDVLGFFLSVYTSSTLSSADVCIQLNAQENFVGRTEEGIMIGSTLAEVEAAYGPPLFHDTDRDYYRYNTSGMGFFYNASTLEVETIAIFPPYSKKSTNFIHQIIDIIPLRDLDLQR